MRKRWITGLVGITALVAGAATLAQQKPPRASSVPWKPAEPRRDQVVVQGKVEVPFPTIPSDSPVPVAQANPVPADDPMTGVEAFLTRNRKEADDSIQALTQEAENLRARLTKVEAALARWQNIAGALNADQKPGVEPEPTLELVPTPAISESTQPPKEITPPSLAPGPPNPIPPQPPVTTPPPG